ncbi:metallophosphoesterase family protein [Pedobacter sp. BS3]|uniref:metallophosphoesterase family protein n=1 Tax=Pedobacter sp. BS3 TaxID=2567937 RepID=UPI0011EC9C6C|nr:metallophosphoesterase family protein [Pedobacter sp. BS3]TZF81717.1 metallophosphoesterase family protein [Pedobacter sp. BS3]
MKLALFSDIHGNLPALEAVLADIEAHHPDDIYCLGDLVNFAPWTNEVINVLRERNIPVIMGNHDEGIGHNKTSFAFSFRSEEERQAGLQAIAVTNKQISAENREYLRTLPRNMRLETGDSIPYIRMLMTHASPESINQYIQEDFNEPELLAMMDSYNADIMLMGHTHRPYHRLLFTEQNNEKIYKHAINAGSVGKPKDGDMRAAWCLLEITENSSLYDADSIQAHIHRVNYDWYRTIQAIIESEIPDLYAELLIGSSAI